MTCEATPTTFELKPSFDVDRALADAVIHISKKKPFDKERK